MDVSRDQVAALYRQVGPAVYRRALALLHDEHEARDVLQEAFLAFLKNQGSLRGEAKPFTVLYQMATFLSIDRLRRKSKWNNVLSLDAFEADDEDGACPATAVTMGSAAAVEAAQDLAMLTRGEDERTVAAATLYFVEGCTTEEAGHVLGVSRKTIGKLLSAFVERAQKRAARFSESGVA
jgi:RNA polymerase sigma-70 factor (ECF subfamily)